MTFGEIVLGAYDLAQEYARKRVSKAAGIVDDPRVTREDFEHAVIALQFDLMGVELAQLQLMKTLHEHAMQQIRARADADRAAGNVPAVTIVQPTGEEEFRPVFTPKKWRP